MARNSEEESCKVSEQEEEEEEDDEALSLSDLPLNFINEESSLQSSRKLEATQVKENEEEFNFYSWGGSLSADHQSEMCAADEVFFKGQILPLRLSVSSDSGLLLARFQNDSRNISRCVSRSESMDRCRSSSTRSHYSSSSSSSNSCITNTTTNSRPKIQNQFHSFPSPKPQIRVSNSRLLGNGSITSRSKKSTVWDFFRIGLVRAPEIEFLDLKVRNNNNINSSVNRSSVSRNSSSGSSSTNSSSSVKNCSVAAKNQQDLKLGKQKNQKSFLYKRKGLFSGCKCSITAVETVPLNNIVIIKSNSDHESSSRRNNNNESNSSTAVKDMEKKLQEWKIKNKMKEKQQGKQAMSSDHRTFEWLKKLSHEGYADDLML